MAQTTANVQVGYEGAVYVAPTGSTAPTDAGTALDAAFLEVGFLDDSGIKITHDDEVTELKAWQRGTVVRKTVTQSDITVAFTMIETNKKSVELFYKKALETLDKQMDESAPPVKLVSIAIDVIDGTKIHRLYLPSCEVTGRDEIAITSEETVKYGVTITAYESSGVKISHFWDSALT